MNFKKFLASTERARNVCIGSLHTIGRKKYKHTDHTDIHAQTHRSVYSYYIIIFLPIISLITIIIVERLFRFSLSFSLFSLPEFGFPSHILGTYTVCSTHIYTIYFHIFCDYYFINVCSTWTGSIPLDAYVFIFKICRLFCFSFGLFGLAFDVIRRRMNENTIIWMKLANTHWSITHKMIWKTNVFFFIVGSYVCTYVCQFHNRSAEMEWSMEYQIDRNVLLETIQSRSHRHKTVAIER